jgi:hypothetical protein
LERYFQDLSRSILKAPQILKISVDKPKKQIRICLLTADQGGQKNRNEKTSVALFYHVFY